MAKLGGKKKKPLEGRQGEWQILRSTICKFLFKYPSIEPSIKYGGVPTTIIP